MRNNYLEIEALAEETSL